MIIIVSNKEKHVTNIGTALEDTTAFGEIVQHQVYALKNYLIKVNIANLITGALTP